MIKDGMCNRSISKEKIRIYDNKFVLFILSFALFVTFIPISLVTSNYTYGLEHLHTLDPSIFADNISVGNITPRFFTNFLVSALMSVFHLGWEYVIVAFLFATAGIYAFAVVNTVERLFERNKGLYVILLTLFLKKSITAGLAVISTCAIEVFGIGTGSALAALAISFCVGKKKKWNISWLIIGIAFFFHVHEGMWGMAAIAVLYVRDIIINKKMNFKGLRTIVVPIIAALVCSLPSLLLGGESTLTSEEFVDIYVNFRTSHHLKPSKWGMGEIVRYYFLMLYPAIFGAIYYLKKKEKDVLKKHLSTVIWLSITWVGAIVVSFLFIEVVPVSFIATMYVPKYLKYVAYMAMLYYLVVISYFVEERNNLLAVAVMVFAFGAKNYSLIVACILCVLVTLMIVYRDKVQENVMCLLLLVCATYYFVGNCLSQNAAIIITMYVVLVMLYTCTERFRSTLMILFTVVALCVGAQGKLYVLEDGRIDLVSPRRYLVRASTEEVYELALKFKEKTDKDEMFITNSTLEIAGWFELISERNCFVLWKTLPSSNDLIEDWYERFHIANRILDKDMEYIKGVLQEYDCKYLFVSADYFEKFEGDEDFRQFIADKTEEPKYRVYIYE